MYVAKHSIGHSSTNTRVSERGHEYDIALNPYM